MAIYERDENGVRSFSDEPGNNAIEYETPMKRAQDAKPKPKALPAGADGANIPDVVRDFRAKNRERRLLQGLPARTSSFARRTALQNASRGGFAPDSYFGRKQTSAVVKAGGSPVEALRQQYAGEDAAYGSAYKDITGDATAQMNSGTEQSDRLALQGARGDQQMAQQEQRQQFAQDTLNSENERSSANRRRDLVSQLVGGLTGDATAGLAAGELGDTSDPRSAIEGALGAVEGTQPGFRPRSGNPNQSFLGSAGSALMDLILGPEEIAAEDLPTDLRRGERPGMAERFGLSMLSNLTGDEDVYEGEGGNVYKRKPSESVRTLRSILNQ